MYVCVPNVDEVDTRMHFSISGAATFEEEPHDKRFGLLRNLDTIALLLLLTLLLSRPAASVLPSCDWGQSMHTRSLSLSSPKMFAPAHSPMCVIAHFGQEYLQRVASAQIVR